MCYSVLPYKLDKKYNKYLVGYSIKYDLYIYCAYYNLSKSIFCGTCKDVVNFLKNERLVKDAKRKITEDGKFVKPKHRLWQCRKQKRKNNDTSG